MGKLVWVVAVLQGMVSFFLLLGTSHIVGQPLRLRSLLLASVLAGAYGGSCLVPGLYFLGNTLWRLMALCITAWAAFGFRIRISCWAVYTLLQLALTGVAVGLHSGGIWSGIGAAAVVCGLWLASARQRSRRYIPVELTHEGRHIRLTALWDTGNILRDPVTGQAVLVVGADVANALTGLTREQLRKPLEVMTAAPVSGLRLIPYRTMDKTGGMLLAMRIGNVKIGTWKGSSLVAFAPEGLDEEGRFQALTGGAA